MEDSSTPLLDVWADEDVGNWAGLEHISKCSRSLRVFFPKPQRSGCAAIVDYINADAQYAAGGAPVQQPVVAFNCSAANCVVDGLTVTGAEVGDPTKHPMLINFSPPVSRSIIAGILPKSASNNRANRERAASPARRF